MTAIIAIRPEPGCAATVALGAEMGLAIEPFPLFAAEPVAWSAPDSGSLDAILIGSANVLRHGGCGLDGLRSLPALCVGEATAQAARDAGFHVVATGTGGLQSVLPIAQRMGMTRLLRLSGEARAPLTLPEGISTDTRTCYRIDNRPIGTGLAERLRNGALVLLHSGEAAAHLSAETDRLSLPRSAIAAACLAPRIAQRAGGGWAALSTASKPQDAALLALAAQMCQA